VGTLPHEERPWTKSAQPGGLLPQKASVCLNSSDTRRLIILFVLETPPPSNRLPVMDISSFAWPLAALVGVLAVAKMFKLQIAGLLDRTTKVSKDGLTAGSASSLQLTDGPRGTVSESLQKALNSTSTMMNIELTRIKDLLKNANITEPVEQITFLTHRLAVAELIIGFENTRSVIFGSQEKVVTACNARNGGYHMDVIREEYNIAAERWPELYEGFTFEQWFDFLISQELVEVIDNRVVIAHRGREYLAYLVQTGKNGQKNL
jgi:hypothetical protein